MLPKTVELLTTPLAIMLPDLWGGTSSLSFAAKGTLAEKSEGHWLHFPLSPGEGSFHSTLHRGRGNSFKFLHIRPKEQGFASWNVPSQNIRSSSQRQAYLTSVPFLSSEEIRTKRKHVWAPALSCKLTLALYDMQVCSWLLFRLQVHKGRAFKKKRNPDPVFKYVLLLSGGSRGWAVPLLLAHPRL